MAPPPSGTKGPHGGWTGGRAVVSQTPHQHRNPQSGGNLTVQRLSLRAEGFGPHSRPPASRAGGHRQLPCSPTAPAKAGRLRTPHGGPPSIAWFWGPGWGLHSQALGDYNNCRQLLADHGPPGHCVDGRLEPHPSPSPAFL